MNTCADVLVWNISTSLGLVASLVSLWYAVADQRDLRSYLQTRIDNPMMRALSGGMTRRMTRNAGHAVFTEVVRALALALFLLVGVASLLGPARVCAINPLSWILIAAEMLVSLNSLHALYTRRGNDFSEGPDDDRDAERDVARDDLRDPGRDQGRDDVRDPARDIARDKEHDSG